MENNILPLISVIIPVYNVEKYLRECLDSVLAQTYKNLEIILIDDGSPDNCGKICDEYAQKDNRIKVIHQVNQGVSAARNAGLKVATGEYIAFVDSDDFIKPDMYEYLYALISKEHADMAMCNVIQTDTFQSAAPIQANYRLIKNRDIFDYSDWMYLVNKLFSHAILAEYTMDETTSYGEDALFIFNLVKQNILIALGNKETYFYRKNPTSAIHVFKPSHLNKLKLTDQCLQYAKEHHLTKFYNSRLRAQFNHIANWLHMLSNSSNPDQKSIQFLISYIKTQWLLLIFRSTCSIKQKCYLTLCCINFPLANKIYQLLKGNK